jgi:hypothetical protein
MTHGFGWLGGYSTGQGPVGSGGFHVFLFDWRLVLRVCVQSSTVGGRQAVHARGRLLFLSLCLCVCKRKRDASRDLTRPCTVSLLLKSRQKGGSILIPVLCPSP